MASNSIPAGLVVTAKQTYYPIELSNSELLAHYETIQEYQQDILSDMLAQSNKYKPNTKLIDQQPEMNPLETRTPTITFLYELSVMTRVTNGIFFQACRLYDRYCSKRVVLKDQAKLVVATCLWLSAKTWGGCNHIINNVVVPTGGRFYGPNPRARIPRLSELVHYCGGSDIFDESMFLQMERHILDTLNWEICEPMINDFVLNVDENCLIQYELYERQIEQKNKFIRKRESQTSQDSDATVDFNDDSNSNNTADGHNQNGISMAIDPANMDTTLNDDEDEDLKLKIQLINLKKFLIDLSTWQYDLLNFEIFELAHGIFSIINRFTSQDQGPFLVTPTPSINKQTQLFNIFINAVVNTPASLLEIYKEQKGIISFIKNVKNYHADLQKKMQMASSIDLSRRITVNTNYPQSNSNIPSPIYSNQSYTPMRNGSAQSENSVFSTVVGQGSPITPTLHTFQHLKNDSACTSSMSVASIPNGKINGYNNNGNMMTNQHHMDDQYYNESNKENQYPNHIPPRAKFINTGMFQSPSGTINSNTSSNRSSMISLALANTTNSMAT